MKITAFEDIIAWQQANELKVSIYMQFGDCQDYSFRNQIQRASVSVMNNIAEGYERNGNKEFRNFLHIARGSSAEVRSMLYLALELKYISAKEYKELNDSSLMISRLLSGLIETL